MEYIHRTDGKISTTPRDFEDVVSDLREIVYSVIRFRPVGEGFKGKALGSGFFVSHTVFLTCNHVINGNKDPHKENDQYQLVSNLGPEAAVHTIQRGAIGINIHLFPDCDVALLICDEKNPAFAALDVREAPYGKEIGVAGYPLPRLAHDGNGAPRYEGLTYRVAKGTVTSTFNTNITTVTGEKTGRVSVIEVNFLFVPGNSGGPVFDSRTARVLGFIHGFQSEKINERLADVTMIENLPDSVGKQYVESMHAIYSIAIQIRCVQACLEQLGVRV